jgi:4-hydroxy-2-oxoglutarate aldolase
MVEIYRPLPRGIYTPLPTFFRDDEELDLEALAQHVKFTATAGTFPVVCGSAGEAAHLSPEERTLVIRTTREALASCGLSHVPIVAGAGAPSTRETVRLAREAGDAGADYVMVIPPGYYAGALQSNGGEALRRFFVDVAAASPLPVVVYNFPGVSAGIDLDSDLILDVVREAPNVVGVKLTYGTSLFLFINLPRMNFGYRFLRSV